jgi:hypothetical protein
MQTLTESFTARVSRRLLSNKCSVIIDLSDGHRMRIGGFAHESIAKYWVDHEAKNWLRQLGRWLEI